jgi:serine phosphatase RsbU (regulator of sigma subunit)
VASTLQGALLPQSLPSVAGLRFDAIYVPGSSEAEIGGDWYDAFVLPDGRVGITIGDVTGQGVTAAVAMGRLRQAMQSVAFIRPDPVAMLEAAELALRSCTASSDIATAFAAVFDPASRTVLYASGGHPAPLLRLPDGTLQELDAPGKLLGLKSKSRNLRSSSAVLVPAGSFVAFYTDGLTEATRDVFTIEARLHEALRGPAVISAEHPAQALHDAVLDTKSHDDLAILTLSVGG